MNWVSTWNSVVEHGNYEKSREISTRLLENEKKKTPNTNNMEGRCRCCVRSIGIKERVVANTLSTALNFWYSHHNRKRFF